MKVLGRRPGVDLGLVWRLRRLYQELGPDLVHAHQYTPYFYAATACLLTPPLKVIFTEHGRHTPDRRRPKRVIYNQLLRAVTAGYTAVSAFTRESLVTYEKMPRSQIKVIYNGVAADPAAPRSERCVARRNLGLALNARIILSAGRMDRVKDFATLVRALQQVIHEVPDALLLVAGEGDHGYVAELRHLSAVLGVAAQVHFLGSRPDVFELFVACDVFALTSLTEGTSMTILEAMWAARPVVATHVGGNPELVVPGHTGILVSPGDVTAVARALVCLLRDPEEARRMGTAGRQRVAERFHSTRTLEAYRALYREARRR